MNLVSENSYLLQVAISSRHESLVITTPYHNSCRKKREKVSYAEAIATM